MVCRTHTLVPTATAFSYACAGVVVILSAFEFQQSILVVLIVTFTNGSVACGERYSGLFAERKEA